MCQLLQYSSPNLRLKEIKPNLVDVLVSEVGRFPLRSSIAHIAQDPSGNEVDFYEYATDSMFNPL
jgi:hypothetical protein